MKHKIVKLEYHKPTKTILININGRLYTPILFKQNQCLHKKLHIEGKYLAFLVCSCGEKWQREVNYIKNTRYTTFKRLEEKLINP